MVLFNQNPDEAACCKSIEAMSDRCWVGCFYSISPCNILMHSGIMLTPANIAVIFLLVPVKKKKKKLHIVVYLYRVYQALLWACCCTETQSFAPPSGRSLLFSLYTNGFDSRDLAHHTISCNHFSFSLLVLRMVGGKKKKNLNFWCNLTGSPYRQ